MQCIVTYAADVYSYILFMWGSVVIFQSQKGSARKKSLGETGLKLIEICPLNSSGEIIIFPSFIVVSGGINNSRGLLQKILNMEVWIEMMNQVEVCALMWAKFHVNLCEGMTVFNKIQGDIILDSNALSFPWSLGRGRNFTSDHLHQLWGPPNMLLGWCQGIMS